MSDSISPALCPAAARQMRRQDDRQPERGQREESPRHLVLTFFTFFPGPTRTGILARSKADFARLGGCVHTTSVFRRLDDHECRAAPARCSGRLIRGSIGRDARRRPLDQDGRGWRWILVFATLPRSPARSGSGRHSLVHEQHSRRPGPGVRGRGFCQLHSGP